MPGTTVEVASRFRDKVKMKDALAGSSIRLPRYLAVGSGSLREFAGKLTGKVVLKPRSQAASMGVQVFASGDDLIRYAACHEISPGYEVEEFVEGAICHSTASYATVR